MVLQIVPLNSKHDRKRFDCSQEILNRWLREVAYQHQEKHISRSFVLIDSEDDDNILGFYSLAAGEILSENFPSTKRLPRVLPIVRIGRLAVSKAKQGEKLGEYLLMDALQRAWQVAQIMGIHAVVVDAKNTAAANFYSKYGFAALTGQPLTLVLAIKTLTELFQHNEEQ